MITRNLLLFTLLATAGCASVHNPPDGVTDEQLAADYDPLEALNRPLFAFNEAVDENVIEPVAEAYRDVVPELMRDGLRNFVENLREPVTFANLLLQGRPEDAAATGGRFLLNSTFGIAGVRDVATCSGYERRRETFGRTLRSWGVGPGSYLVVPLIGPSSPRSLVGAAVDGYAGPGRVGGSGLAALTAAGAVDARSRVIELLDFIRRAEDYYAIARRRHLLGFDDAGAAPPRREAEPGR